MLFNVCGKGCDQLSGFEEKKLQINKDQYGFHRWTIFAFGNTFFHG